MNEFKDMLLYIRKRSNVSQLELAEALGLSKSMISMYERGVRHPSYETLEAIADYFNVDMDFLAGRDPNQAPRLSGKAMMMAAKYDKLDSRGQALVDAVIQHEIETVEEKSK